MKSIDYFKRFGYWEPQIKTPLQPETTMIVVIPAYNEPELISTIKSLQNCDPPKAKVEIIIVFNASESLTAKEKEEHRKHQNEVVRFVGENRMNYPVHNIDAFDLPSKHAGVGLARKIGMDEAAFRFASFDQGLIIALDADCMVAPNYLVAIESHFKSHPKSPGASIHYEHRFNASESLNRGIINYELHLRYYNQLIAYSGHPMAFHTVGSSMVVTAEAYKKQGGMNKRKAGEDFYFLQKIMLLGTYSNIKNTCVYPSARISLRVPFGTGKAQSEWQQKKHFKTYHPDLAILLKQMFDEVTAEAQKKQSLLHRQLPKPIQAFITIDEWEGKMKEIHANSTDELTFKKRFFAWFNLFKIMQLAHFYRDRFKPNVPLVDAASTLLKLLNEPVDQTDELSLLKKFREIELR